MSANPIQDIPSKTKKRKLPGMEVQLHDGTVVVVRELRSKEMKLVLQAMPALKKIAESFKNASGEVSGLPMDLPEDILESAYPLLEACTDISQAELRENYSLGEVLSFLTTFNKLLAKNFSTGTKAEQPESPAASKDMPSA